MMKEILVFGLLVAVGASPLLADSDGYYCSAPGYVAYELNSMVDRGHGPTGPEHTLQVVRFGNSDGISSASELKLPNFQLHGLKCYADSLEMISWDSIYSVDLKDPKSPKLANTTPLVKEGAIPQGYEPSTLRRTNAEGTPTISKLLEAADQTHHYELVITQRIGPHGRNHSLFADVQSQIVQKDLQGHITKKMTLLADLEPTEGGE